MNRAEIEATWKVYEGRIASPGKFQGEPVYAPAFHDFMLDGEGIQDDHEDGWCSLAIYDEDRREWPELGTAQWVLVREDEQGFVHTKQVE